MSDDYYETIEDTGELSDDEQDNNVAASVVDNHPEYDARFISNFTNLISESATPFEAYCGTYAGSSISYFAGYAGHITTKKFECSRCYDLLLKAPEATGDADDSYIECREYESKMFYKVTMLKRPSAKFREIVTANLLTFERNIHQIREK